MGRKKMEYPDVEMIRRLIHYDPDTGLLTAKSNHHPRRMAGTVYDCREPRGYILVGVCKRRIYAHRVAWALMTGSWPTDEIDHINCDKSDNRFSNLREATAAENLRNKSGRKYKKSGLKGVAWHAKNKKWQATIGLDRKVHYLGLFDTREAAHEAYKLAATRLHGEFANPG